MAKKKPARPVRRLANLAARRLAARTVKKAARRRPSNRPSSSSAIDRRVDAAIASLLSSSPSSSERPRFLSLESQEPGQVHINMASIEVVSHPVQKAAGEHYILYVTLKSGQKTVILDTPENRTTLGLPFAPPMVPRAAAPRPDPRAPRLRRRATIAPPQADPNAEPTAHDEDDAEQQ